jgi:hypothetical protein
VDLNLEADSSEVYGSEQKFEFTDLKPSDGLCNWKLKVTGLKDFEVENEKIQRGEVYHNIYNYISDPYSIPLNERMVQFVIKTNDC